MLSLTNKKIHVSRDVVFHGTVFPFSTTSKMIISPISQFHYTSIFDHHTPVTDHPSTSHNDHHIQNDNIPSPSGERCISKSDNVQCDLEHASVTPPSLLQNQSTHNTSELVPLIRKSTRTHKIPAHLNDYLYTRHQLEPPIPHSLHASFSNHHHISFELLYPDSQSLVLSVSHDCEPSTYEEVAMDPIWQAAMTQELSALHDNNTSNFVLLPYEKKVIGCKWVCKI